MRIFTLILDLFQLTGPIAAPVQGEARVASFASAHLSALAVVASLIIASLLAILLAIL